MRLDFAQDYTVFDGLESVMLDVAESHLINFDPAGLLPFASAQEFQSEHQEEVFQGALRRAISIREAADSGGAYTASDVVWWLPAAAIAAGVTPKPGDLLTGEDGTRWTVLEVGHNVLRNAWRCVSRNLKLAFDLRETIDIERPTVSYDDAGVQVRTFPPNGGKAIYQGINANIQSISQDIVDERGIRGFSGTHLIIVDQQLLLTKEDRVNLQGKYFEILGYRNTQRLDQLPAIDAKLAP